MKKLVSRLAIAVVCFALALSCLAGCGAKGNGGDNGDGSGNEPTPEYYHVLATDQNGDPVAGAWFDIYYYDVEAIAEVTVPNTTTETDENGVANFENFTPSAGIDYRVRIASSVPKGEKAIPDKYEAVERSVKFNGKKAEFKFNYYPDRFTADSVAALAYSRAYDFAANEAKESKTPLSLTLSKGAESYFYFMPYSAPALVKTGEWNDATQNPYTDDEVSEENARRLALATTAATGKYQVAYSVEGSANATLTLYVGTRANMQTDSETGKPSEKEKVTASGETSITMNRHRRIVLGETIFGLVADADCKATVTVTRIADADEPQEINTTVPAPDIDNWTQVGANGATLIDAPLDSSRMVLGTDEFYHIDSADGALLYVQLNNTMDRTGDLALSDRRRAVQGTGVYGDSAYIFSTVNEDETVYSTYDYNAYIDRYAECANSDGAYPVDEDMRTFLELISPQLEGAATAGKDNTWLLYCQYYSNDLGTPSNPVGLDVGANSIDPVALGLSTVTLSFTPEEDGTYSFTSTDSLGLVSTYGHKYGNTVYATVKKDATFVLSVSATDAVTVTVGTVDAIAATASTGTASSPIAVTAAGITPYRVDNTVSSDGVHIAFQAAEGKYVFELDNSATSRIYYNGEYYKNSELTVVVTNADTVYDIVLTSVSTANGVYWLNINKVAELKLGVEEAVSIGINESASYVFTANEYGLYRIIIGGADASSVDPVSKVRVFIADSGEDVELVFESGDHTKTVEATVEIVRVTTVSAGTAEETSVSVPATTDPIELTFEGSQATYTLTVNAPISERGELPQFSVKVNGNEVTFTPNSANSSATATGITLRNGDTITIECAGQINFDIKP